VGVTQRAYAACVETPKPCIETLAKVGSQKVEDVTANWKLVVELMAHPENSVTNTLGYFEPARMEADYNAVQTSFDDLKAFDIGSAYRNDLRCPLPASKSQARHPANQRLTSIGGQSVFSDRL